MKSKGIVGEHIQIKLDTSGNIISDMHATIAVGTKRMEQHMNLLKLAIQFLIK